MTALIVRGRLHAQRERREDEAFEDDGLMPVDWGGHAVGVPVPSRLSALRHRLVSKRPVASHRVSVAPAFANAAMPPRLPGDRDAFRLEGNWILCDTAVAADRSNGFAFGCTVVPPAARFVRRW